jgi:hypothetical protein
MPDRPSKFLNLLPFGIPTLIIAEDPQLLAAAAAAYAHWVAEAPAAAPSIEVLLETGSLSTTGVSLDITVDGSRIRVERSGAKGTGDAATGRARAIVSRQLTQDAAAFVELLDTLLLFLLARHGRTPVHASAFMLRDVALVLAGPSGSGKSTLALAAAQRGCPVLSDDMVFVQREPQLIVWGFPRPMHLFPEDAPAGDHRTRMRNEKLKASVPIGTTQLKAKRAVLIVLERGSAPCLSPIDGQAAVELLMNLDAGFDLLEQESRSAIEALASGGAWRLTLASDPAVAIAFLASRFAAQS